MPKRGKTKLIVLRNYLKRYKIDRMQVCNDLKMSPTLLQYYISLGDKEIPMAESKAEYFVRYFQGLSKDM